MDQQLLDSLRAVLQVAEHGRHHASSYGQYGAWAGMIGLAVALTRFEKVLEILGRMFGRKPASAPETIKKANGSDVCPLHSTMSLEIADIKTSATEHHRDQMAAVERIHDRIDRIGERIDRVMAHA